MSKKPPSKAGRKPISLSIPGQSAQTLSAYDAILAGRRTLHSIGPEAALDCIKQIRSQLPDYTPAQVLEAESLLIGKKYEPAKKILLKLRSKEPNNPEVHFLLFKLNRQTGNLTAAFEALKRAIKLQPTEAAYYISAGTLYREMGNNQKARDFFKRAIEANPLHPDAYVHKTYIPGITLEPEEVDTCWNMINSTKFSRLTKSLLYFALARHYENAGEPDRTIEVLERANQLKHRDLDNPAPVARIEQLETIRNVFTQEIIKKVQLESYTDLNLLFIVSFPRSGSTLVEQILASHSQVSAAGETNGIATALYATDKMWAYPEWIRSASQADLEGLKNTYLGVIEKFRERKFLTDKSLENIYHVGLIKTLFPNARIIHVWKDPVECCFGCYRQVFQGPVWPSIYSLEGLREAYTNYHRVMQHWDTVFPGEILHFRYEDLVADQEKQSRVLLEYCGLPWEDNCLEFHQLKNRVATASASQVKEKISSRSIGRWKKYEEHLKPLLPLQELAPWPAGTI